MRPCLLIDMNKWEFVFHGMKRDKIKYKKLLEIIIR